MKQKWGEEWRGRGSKRRVLVQFGLVKTEQSQMDRGLKLGRTEVLKWKWKMETKVRKWNENKWKRRTLRKFRTKLRTNPTGEN